MYNMNVKQRRILLFIVEIYVVFLLEKYNLKKNIQILKLYLKILLQILKVLVSYKITK